MALVGNDLGALIHQYRQNFNNKTVDELLMTYGGTMETIREMIAKGEETIRVNYFKTNTALSVPGTGLTSPSGGGAVTGTSTTGTIS